jgi:hypothetical protein
VEHARSVRDLFDCDKGYLNFTNGELALQIILLLVEFILLRHGSVNSSFVISHITIGTLDKANATGTKVH